MMCIKERNTSDATCKKLLRDKGCFVDFCNYAFFQGRQIIQPEELVSRENDLSTLIGKIDKPTEIKRYRDVVRKASIHGEYVIIGVEHQSTFDEKMIFRILNYDATVYINQVESKQEIYPVGSFAFYTGDKEWKSPETLKNIPPDMEPYINDWRLPVVELKTMDARKLTNQRLKEVVEISQSMFAGNYDDLRNNRKIETENFMMAATFTRTKIKREDLPEGDEINMCEAMDRLFQRFENQGIEKGERSGIEKGKSDTLKDLLKVKLGTLSRPLEKQLTNTSLEKLNELTLNIFNVTNEEDVLKIIN